MRRSRLLNAAVGAVAALALAAAPVFGEAPLPAQPGLAVRMGQAPDFSRIEFRWSGAAKMQAHRDGQVLTVSFDRDARPDVAALQSVPLKWLTSVAVRHDPGGISFVLTLAHGADAVVGGADGADFVNIFPKGADPAQAQAPAQAPPATRPDPTPADGVVRMRVSANGPQLRLDFPWRNPCGAAVFRRGDAIWVVFDAQARIDISAAPRTAAQFASIQTVSGPGYSAVRIATRAPVAFAAEGDGADWGVLLEPAVPPPYTPVKLGRDDSAGPMSLTAEVAGATGVFWIPDPAVGDKIGVVTALAPSKGLPTPHDFIQFSLLQSAQGLAVAAQVDGLSVAYQGDIVTVSRADGLVLSAPMSKVAAASALDAPRPAATPGLIGSDWGQTGGDGFVARYDALSAPLADEEEKGAEGPVSAHIALARFLIGSGLSFEAIGVLDDAIRLHPTLEGDPEFRALRGMARAMARRFTAAETDLSSAVLDDNPAASLWRGYVKAKTSQWADARKAFASGASALSQFPPAWRQRFARAAAQTALALGDTQGARSWINFALANRGDDLDDAETQLVKAEVDQASGDTPRALAEYSALAQSPQDKVAGPALLRVTQIKLSQNAVTPVQAINTYDQLRYRWRGGVFELQTVRALGQLYLSQGRYREAMEALESAGKNLPDLPESVKIQTDLSSAFKYLFLDGGADGLQPIQALGLFYDFKALTPVGVEGDEMVRRLVQRLVQVDLLPQAEQLLQYQVDNRLEGVSKAEVATDLAVIYLMDRKPEQALDSINASRTTVLPMSLNLQRRIVTARALTELGRYGLAQEMLGKDDSADATEVRAEILWRQRDWPGAGAIFERELGDRYKTAGPLSALQEGQLLRAAVAYSLAGDDTSLTRLRQRWSSFVAGAHDPDALRVALSGISAGSFSPDDLSRVAADNQLFEGWFDKMKARFAVAPLPEARTPESTRQASLDAPAQKRGKG